MVSACMQEAKLFTSPFTLLMAACLQKELFSKQAGRVREGRAANQRNAVRPDQGADHREIEGWLIGFKEERDCSSKCVK